MCLINKYTVSFAWCCGRRSLLGAANSEQGPDVKGWNEYIQPILEFCDEHVA